MPRQHQNEATTKVPICCCVLLQKGVYRDGAGSSFIKWCGLLINTSNLELQADYTRYAGLPLSSTLTVPLSKVPSCCCPPPPRSLPSCALVPSLYTYPTPQYPHSTPKRLSTKLSTAPQLCHHLTVLFGYPLSTPVEQLESEGICRSTDLYLIHGCSAASPLLGGAGSPDLYCFVLRRIHTCI